MGSLIEWMFITFRMCVNLLRVPRDTNGNLIVLSKFSECTSEILIEGAMKVNWVESRGGIGKIYISGGEGLVN